MAMHLVYFGLGVFAGGVGGMLLMAMLVSGAVEDERNEAALQAFHRRQRERREQPPRQCEDVAA